MQIRVAAASDISGMHRVRMSVRENELSDDSRVQPHHYQSLLEGGGRGWVAEFENRIVGFAVADRERSNIWALFVDPDFEGRGIGRRLHDAMLDWLFASGAQRLWLTTSPGTRAERFYRSARWSRTGIELNGEIRYEMSRRQWLGTPKGK